MNKKYDIALLMKKILDNKKFFSGNIDEVNLGDLPDGFSSWEEYYLTKRPGQDACKRTSYNTYGNEHLLGDTPFRGNYAGQGFTYDSSNDVFYVTQPHASWTLDNSDWLW